MARWWGVWLCCAMGAEAAMIRGVVLEHVSGRPLARARVKLEALQGNSVVPFLSTAADRGGQFGFFSLPAGTYLLSAERSAFAVARYGQKRKSGPGAPIPLDTDSSFFAEIRLSRLAAITGTVFDENRVGLPGQKVVVYPHTPPPLRIAATGQSDDRGVYRVPRLGPGRYLVRTGAATLDDGSGALPTFYPETLSANEAKVVTVRLDEEAGEINIQPLPGRLFRLTVYVVPPPGAPGPVSVTLSSDTGRQQVSGAGKIPFDGLAPGAYELAAEAGSLGAHQELFVDRELEVTLELLRQPMVQFRVEDESGNALRDKLVS